MGEIQAKVTAFVCINCSRDGVDSLLRFRRPILPAIPWKGRVRHVMVPCAGRLQPEHLLKAFEGGADLVCVIGCEEDNCHYLEGCCRAARRVEYVDGLLKEIGLGDGRIVLATLPGSGRQDMAAGVGDLAGAKSVSEEELSRRLEDIGTRIAERLQSLPRNPMGNGAEAEQNPEITELEETEENED